MAENGWGGWPGAPRTRGARWGGLETVFVRFTAIRARAPIFGRFERCGRAVSPPLAARAIWSGLAHPPVLGRSPWSDKVSEVLRAAFWALWASVGPCWDPPPAEIPPKTAKNREKPRKTANRGQLEGSQGRRRGWRRLLMGRMGPLLPLAGGVGDGNIGKV